MVGSGSGAGYIEKGSGIPVHRGVVRDIGAHPRDTRHGGQDSNLRATGPANHLSIRRAGTHRAT